MNIIESFKGFQITVFFSIRNYTMGQLICFFQFPFRSVPLHSSSIQLNRKGTGLIGTERERNTGMERERNGIGKKMEQKFNGGTMNAQFMVPVLLYDCIRAGSPKPSFHCSSIELLFHFRSIPVPFHSRSSPVRFLFNFHLIEWKLKQKQMS